VGVRGGAKAAVHATQAFVSPASPCHLFNKLDMVNAFNTVRRDSIFETVASKVPELLPYVFLSYELPSSLSQRCFTLLLSEGVQQGDSLGSLLFSLTILDALKSFNCTFTAGYLDDITLGDTVDTLSVEVIHFQNDVTKMGLSLHESKCKGICLADDLR